MVKSESEYSPKALLLGQLFTWKKSIIIFMEAFHMKCSTVPEEFILFNWESIQHRYFIRHCPPKTHTWGCNIFLSMPTLKSCFTQYKLQSVCLSFDRGHLIMDTYSMLLSVTHSWSLVIAAAGCTQAKPPTSPPGQCYYGVWGKKKKGNLFIL